MRPDGGRSRYYWLRHTDGTGGWRQKDGPPGHELAALRRGVGREAGAVPQMWPYYTTLTESGQVTPRLRAEHVALTLFAVHQQSKARPVHRFGIGVGRALHELRRSERFSDEAVDRRFAAAATATSFLEVSYHLRALLTQLRAVDGAALDYTRLYDDLVAWQDPEQRIKVCRVWGALYFTAVHRAEAGTDAGGATEPSKEASS